MAMMGIRPDTKAFNPSPSESNANSNKNVDLSKTMTPQELQSLGVSDMGELLNKVADANWVDPKSKLRGAGSDKLDKDAFMKIMLTQMKNQDPTNPLKSHEMAAQLAQFTQLEQLQNINTSLDEMKAQAKPAESFQSLNLLGKVVSGDSRKIYRSKGDKDHDISYVLPAGAKTVTIKIFNENGEEVRSFSQNNVKQGNNVWLWNGRDSKDIVLPSGSYMAQVEAVSSNDQKLQVKTDFEGKISGVNFTPQGTVLLIGNQAVRLQDIKKIVDPSLKNKDQNLEPKNVPDLSGALGLGSNKDMGAPDALEAPRMTVLDNASLSREMMEKIEKELKSSIQKGGQ